MLQAGTIAGGAASHIPVDRSESTRASVDCEEFSFLDVSHTDCTQQRQKYEA